jgi:hypothetical protein
LGVPPEQALPQALQLAAVPSGVSQPFAVLPSQFAKPALQLAMAQAPAVHVLLALGSEHVRPHAPQLLSLFCVLTQVMPQRVSPGAQPVPQAPPLQMGVAPEHALAHMPQLDAVSRALSQPLALLLSQSPKPIAQAYWHCPAALQVEGMLGRGAHEPHVPPQPSSPHTRPVQSGVHPGGTNTSGIDASGALASGALLASGSLASLGTAASIDASTMAASIDGVSASTGANCASRSNGTLLTTLETQRPPSPHVSPRASQRSAIVHRGLDGGQSLACAPHSAARYTGMRVTCPGVNVKRTRRVKRSVSALPAHGSALTSNHTTALPDRGPPAFGETVKLDGKLSVSGRELTPRDHCWFSVAVLVSLSATRTVSSTGRACGMLVSTVTTTAVAGDTHPDASASNATENRTVA